MVLCVCKCVCESIRRQLKGRQHEGNVNIRTFWGGQKRENVMVYMLNRSQMDTRCRKKANRKGQNGDKVRQE